MLHARILLEVSFAHAKRTIREIRSKDASILTNAKYSNDHAVHMPFAKMPFLDTTAYVRKDSERALHQQLLANK